MRGVVIARAIKAHVPREEIEAGARIDRALKRVYFSYSGGTCRPRFARVVLRPGEIDSIIELPERTDSVEESKNTVDPGLKETI